MIVAYATLCVTQHASLSATTVGASSIIGTLDYSDTFSINGTTRPEDSVPTTAGAAIENTYSNPATSWTPNSWRIVSDASSLNGTSIYPGSNGAGSSTGHTQTANYAGQFGINYTIDGLATGTPLRTTYIVQVDAVLNKGHIDITSKASANSFFSDAGSLSVFFRQSGNALGITVYDSIRGETKVTDAPAGFADGSWQNLAVEFSPTTLKIYTNQIFLLSVDLLDVGTSHLNYTGYSQNAIGIGFNATALGDRGWFDNFQVGSAVPEPMSHTLFLLGGILICLLRRRQPTSIRIKTR